MVRTNITDLITRAAAAAVKIALATISYCWPQMLPVAPPHAPGFINIGTNVRKKITFDPRRYC